MFWCVPACSGIFRQTIEPDQSIQKARVPACSGKSLEQSFENRDYIELKLYLRHRIDGLLTATIQLTTKKIDLS